MSGLVFEQVAQPSEPKREEDGVDRGGGPASV